MADTTLVDSILKYLKDFHDKLIESNETAKWDLEDESHVQLVIDSMETDAAEIGGGVFSNTVAHVPAQIMAQSCSYDTTQAATRLSKVFATTRDDYYRIADESMSVANDRNSIRTRMLASVVNLSEPLREAYTSKSEA